MYTDSGVQCYVPLVAQRHCVRVGSQTHLVSEHIKQGAHTS